VSWFDEIRVQSQAGLQLDIRSGGGDEAKGCGAVRTWHVYIAVNDYKFIAECFADETT